MKAFHNNEKIKEKYLSRVNAHALADEIQKGFYWEKGRGCAVGCTIHGSDHSAYERELGIPTWLARVEDTLFEGLPLERAKKWPEQFLSSMPIGADLDQIKTPFLVFILKESIQSMRSAKYDAEKFPSVKKALDQSEAAVLQMIECHEQKLDMSAAASAARSAARSAESAARSAAESAARSAARSAAWSAASAAESAASAAWSAAESAASAASAAESAASAAWSAAESAAYERFADKLLELLKESK